MTRGLQERSEWLGTVYTSRKPAASRIWPHSHFICDRRHVVTLLLLHSRSHRPFSRFGVFIEDSARETPGKTRKWQGVSHPKDSLWRWVHSDQQKLKHSYEPLASISAGTNKSCQKSQQNPDSSYRIIWSDYHSGA